MPLTSEVEAITAVDGAPVSFASLFSVVPVETAFVISLTIALLVPKSRLLPSAPVIVGLVIVGLVARTTAPYRSHCVKVNAEHCPRLAALHKKCPITDPQNCSGGL